MAKLALPVENTLLMPKPNTRILLAEDNPANQMVIKSILEFAQLSVDVVSNGYEAIEAVQQIPYDIVLMDVSMPGMDGMLATQAIRALSTEVANIPIVALTAHSLNGDKERFVAAGMNDYLSKPIDRIATLNCIAFWTKNSPSEKNLSALNSDIKVLSRNFSEYLLVDESVLKQLVIDTSASTVSELISLYIVESKQCLEIIKKSLDEQDMASLAFEVHSISSSALAHGNSRLGEQGRYIELLCRTDKEQQAISISNEFVITAVASFRELQQRSEQGF
jgi:CheY-like chemotaxis protein